MDRNLDIAFRVRPLVLDGALGTELEDAGADTSGKSWTARVIDAHPKSIYKVHKNYLWNGADILTANTFRTNPRALKDTGLDAEALTKKAVRIARKARKNKHPLIRIAGSIAPVEDCYSPHLVPPSDAALVEEHRIMARWLDDARVDIILIETMNTVREALCALQAAREESNKYIWVSIVPKDGESMLDDTPLDYAVARLKEGGAHLVALNCAPVRVMMEAMPLVTKAAKRAGVWCGCYPSASECSADGTWTHGVTPVKEITDCAVAWMNAGAVVVGGCCGTTPQTIASMDTQRNLFYINRAYTPLPDENDASHSAPIWEDDFPE